MKLLTTVAIVGATLLFNNKGTTQQDFRIPAVCTDGKGHIVAFSDRRFSVRGGDIGAGEIDIQARFSNDFGKSWDGDPNNPCTLIDGVGGDGFDCAHGDAAVVRDRVSGEILLMCACGSVGYPDGGCLIGRYYSRDGGRSFIGGEMNEGNGLPAELATSRKFFSSGRICQSRKIKKGTHFRIYAGVPCSEGGQVVFSDDFGRNWACLGAPVPDADECKVEELPDGSVLLSSRIRGGKAGRMFNVFTYSGKGWENGKWSRSVVSAEMTAAACNGEILIVKAPVSHKGGKWILLQSVARSQKRENVSIYWKNLGPEDDFTNPDFYNKWDGCMQVCQGSSCYSTMVPDGRGNIAFMWEQNNTWRDWVESYDIMFRSIPLSEITSCRF